MQRLRQDEFRKITARLHQGISVHFGVWQEYMS